jgi:hypothetical protein
MALMAATIGFCHWITSFDNRGLTQRMRALLGEDYSSRQATYDLRRLRRKQIICRIPGGHRYQLTQTGRRAVHQGPRAHPRPRPPPSTPSSPPAWPGAARWPSPGETSPPNSAASSTTGWPRPKAET